LKGLAPNPAQHAPAAQPAPAPPPVTAPAARRGSQIAPDVGTVIDGRYKVGALLGRGGFGSVYEAENLRFGGRVALKLLEKSDPNTVRRFHQEARISGTILHPNVCRVFDVGWTNDKPFIVMELLSGETLSTRLERKGPLKVGDAIDIAIQVLAGLGAAHELGIVHRDVKPQNVFLMWRAGCSPMVKLLDFGLAKALSKEPMRGTTTVPGKIVGTITHMSPEQLHGDKIDARSDLFSVAVVLFESLTGVLPWAGKTPTDIGAAILRDQPRSLLQLSPHAPPELEPIIGHGLQKQRSRRFQSAIEFMRALGALQRTRPSILTPAVAQEDESSTGIALPVTYGSSQDGSEDDATTDVTPHRHLMAEGPTPTEQHRGPRYHPTERIRPVLRESSTTTSRRIPRRPS
jgi:serine/threonine-protein kinase